MKRSHRTAASAADQRAARLRRERAREQLRHARRHLASAVAYTVAAIVVYGLQASRPSWLTRTSTVNGVQVASEPQVVRYGFAAAFLVIAIVATRRGAAALDHFVRARSQGSGGAAVRLSATAAGYVLSLFVALGMATGSVSHLLIGAGLAGVVLGIAGQQTLGNVFAGMVLVIARPFTVGDYIRVRSGAYGGIFEGKVNGMSLTYVTLNVEGIEMKVPNSGMLAAAVGKLRRAGQTGAVPVVPPQASTVPAAPPQTGGVPAVRSAAASSGEGAPASGQVPRVRSGRARPPSATGAVPAVPAAGGPAPAADSAGTSAVAPAEDGPAPSSPAPSSPAPSSPAPSSPAGGSSSRSGGYLPDGPEA